MSLYLAEDLEAGAAHPEHDEEIESRWFTPSEIGRMIRSGGIADAKTLVGVLLAGYSGKNAVSRSRSRANGQASGKAPGDRPVSMAARPAARR